jgi:type IV pilus assembly protein PilN
MRIPINLASQPPENLRPLRTGVVVLGLAALVLGGVILQQQLRNRSEFRSLIDRQDQLEQSLLNLQGQQKELESALSTPQAMQIRERSAFLNSLIFRKGISWTQIFMDLEKTLPDKAHIVSIRPSLNSSQEVDLALTVASDAIGPLVEFVKRLEASPQFGSPVVGGQHYGGDKAASGEISMDLTTRYRQERAAAPAPSSESPATASDLPPSGTMPRSQNAREQGAGEPVTREEAAR